MSSCLVSSYQVSIEKNVESSKWPSEVVSNTGWNFGKEQRMGCLGKVLSPWLWQRDGSAQPSGDTESGSHEDGIPG